MSPSSPRHLTEQELKCLERFTVFEISLEQLRSCLRHVMRFDFDADDHEGKRWMENNFICSRASSTDNKAAHRRFNHEEEAALGGHVVEESRQTVYYGW
ncbi:MAG TPA: hypothetical protein VEV41_27225 [Terriglobales bacterium]|nr:hypothetical protein [Terriglobales bacterium]